MKPLESGEALDESFSTPQSQQPSSSSSSTSSPSSPSSASSSSSSSDSSLGSPKTSFGNTEEEHKTSQSSRSRSSNPPFTESNLMSQHFQGSKLNWNEKKKSKMVSKDSMKNNYKAKALGQNRHSSGTRDPEMARQLKELSSMIPGLKKMNSVSIVGGAINYVKQLQERVNILEEQTKNNSVEKTRAFAGEGTSSSMEELPEIDVKVQEKNVLINIYCVNQKGILSKILCEIEKHHLKIVTFSALPFADRFLDTTVSTQMDDAFCMTIEDLKRDLRRALVQFMQHAKT